MDKTLIEIRTGKQRESEREKSSKDISSISLQRFKGRRWDGVTRRKKIERGKNKDVLSLEH